mmetsp:Transcript_21115/g.33103  ORF Transcript_21115/g.33103 Transcript_21115/m.33103 type:complete len:124 (-) Transcript_21115:295-666(-)|eukprot:CAMPEP_0184307692 /NCGR_PEP_ID=MMETSP1049-20130417/16375_1 /TAXON_ID=77928 /ORGANISM="Proteomonas sulcata, Strain CCMP704" /LENGTH=123 /DNA_ID=CAMNT_0026620237 /DNA_START=225 /DNA_END=596 /DNA_ORIENTATION=-
MRGNCLGILIFLIACALVAAGPKKGPRSTADRELRSRRTECERDVCHGLIGETKATCAYKCISSECYDEVYAKDEIEEGEVDTERGRQFNACFRRVYKKEQDDKLAQQRKEKAARKAGNSAES